MTLLFQRVRNRLYVVTVLLALIWLILAGKLFSIQILNKDEHKTEVNNKTQVQKLVEGSRGLILDRNGKPISRNITTYTFSVNTLLEFDREKIISIFNQTFHKPASFYDNKLNSQSKYVMLERDVNELDCYSILEAGINIKGLSIDKSTSRYYPFEELASQVLGYTDRQNNGAIGSEAYFDDVLKGEISTLKYQRNGNKILNTSHYEDQPKIHNGFNIQLTLDMEMQAILSEELTKTLNRVNAKSANGIIIDPVTGEILAMSTVPGLNLNDYNSFPIEKQKNKLVMDAYEPGSTFKAVTLAAALEEGTVTQFDEYDCEDGQYTIFGNTYSDHDPNGNLSVYDIIAQSSNIGMLKIALDMGAENLYNYSRKFGFGIKTGISLYGEEPGTLRPFDQWSHTSCPAVSFGQEISCTTLQMAMAYCVFANGGYLLKPQLLINISDESKVIYESEIAIIRRVISEKTAGQVLAILENVVSSGTGIKAKIPGFKLAGKTGTAQIFVNGKYSDTDFTSSFAGIFPVIDPRYVCVVVFDSPKYGYHWASETAAPTMKNIVKRIISMEGDIEFEDPGIQDIADNVSSGENYPDLLLSKVSIIEKDSSEALVPDFRGLTLRQSINMASQTGLLIDPQGGAGVVRSQSLKPGKKFDKNSVCKVEIN